MTVRRRTRPHSLETAFGPRTQPSRYMFGADGRITQATPIKPIEAAAGTVTIPGLVDIQVNGFAGVDFNAPGLTPERLDRALSAMAASGVTRCLPTLITAGETELVDLLRTLDEAVSESTLGPLMVCGYHIEGPFLSPEPGFAGAHPAHHMQRASRDLVQRLEDVATRPLKIMTVAPEVDGVLDLIPFLKQRGIVVSVGHSAASRATIDAAVEAGVSMSTHLGNGLAHMLNKNENPLLAQLGQDALMAGFIADGIHISPMVLQTYLRAKTRARSMLVTDASAAAGASPETNVFTLGTQKIERHPDGSVRLPGSDYLAGSAMTMDQMVRNLMAWFGFGFAEIVQVARANPLAALSLACENPDVGQPAEFVVWERRDTGFHVREAHVGPWMIAPGDGVCLNSSQNPRFDRKEEIG